MAGHSIFGIYTSRQGVEAAVQALRDANFRPRPGKPRRHSRYRHRQIHQGARRCDHWRRLGGRRRGAGMVGGHRCAGDSGRWSTAPARSWRHWPARRRRGGWRRRRAGCGVPEFEAERYETRLGKGGILLISACRQRRLDLSRQINFGKNWRGRRLQRQRESRRLSASFPRLEIYLLDLLRSRNARVVLRRTRGQRLRRHGAQAARSSAPPVCQTSSAWAPAVPHFGCTNRGSTDPVNPRLR